MATINVDATQGWILAATDSACKISADMGGYGVLRIYIGYAGPTVYSSYFELESDKTFIKEASLQDVYVAAPTNPVGTPAIVTIDTDVYVGNAVSGVADTALRADVGSPNSDYVTVFNTALSI